MKFKTDFSNSNESYEMYHVYNLKNYHYGNPDCSMSPKRFTNKLNDISILTTLETIAPIQHRLKILEQNPSYAERLFLFAFASRILNCHLLHGL